jgi:hypothetical protein
MRKNGSRVSRFSPDFSQVKKTNNNEMISILHDDFVVAKRRQRRRFAAFLARF